MCYTWHNDYKGTLLRDQHFSLPSFPLLADLHDMFETQFKRYTRKAKPTGEVLGSGTYGRVIELTSGQNTLAGKIFRISAVTQLQAIATKVCGEVITMLQLSHPNIVQCEGVALLPDQSPLPVLLMEKLMTSLHAYLLDPDNSNLPAERKVSFLLDTARGLDYLHSRTPAIIHRDLTATNVLLDCHLSGVLTAKITDFGNSRFMDLDPSATPETFTSVPGTINYMPPEVQGCSVKYGPSVDVFSFGHLSLFTVLQTQVNLLPPTYIGRKGTLNSLFIRASHLHLPRNLNMLAKLFHRELKILSLGQTALKIFFLVDMPTDLLQKFFHEI